MDHKLCIASYRHWKLGMDPDNQCKQFHHSRELLFYSWVLVNQLMDFYWYSWQLLDQFRIHFVFQHSIEHSNYIKLFCLAMIRISLCRCWTNLGSLCKRYRHKMVFKEGTFCNIALFYLCSKFLLFPLRFWSNCSHW